jgi:phage shock protein A
MTDFNSPEKLTCWLMGDWISEPTMRAWKWLWGIPAPPDPNGDDITIADLERLLVLMHSQLLNIAPLIKRVRAETAEICQLSGSKRQSYRQLVDRVRAAKQRGNMTEARLQMAKAIQIEQILPELDRRVERAQQQLGELVEIQARKESELSLLSFDLQAVKIQIEINRALYRDLNPLPELITLLDRFQDLSERSEDFYCRIQVLSQFSPTSNCMIRDPDDSGDLDDRIDLL